MLEEQGEAWMGLAEDAAGGRNQNKVESRFVKERGSMNPAAAHWMCSSSIVAVAAVACLFLGFQHTSANLPPGTECIPILTELEPCLPFVQYSGEKPTSDCCTVLKDVHTKSAKCLCRLIAAEKNQPPTPGINLTLAFLLPDACHLKVNPKRCPALLEGDPPFASLGVPTSPSSASADASTPSVKPSSSSSLQLICNIPSSLLLLMVLVLLVLCVC